MTTSIIALPPNRPTDRLRAFLHRHRAGPDQTYRAQNTPRPDLPVGQGASSYLALRVRYRQSNTITLPTRCSTCFKAIQSSENQRDLMVGHTCDRLTAAAPPSSKPDFTLAPYRHSTGLTLATPPAANPSRREHRSDRTCLQSTKRIQNYDPP